MLNTLIIEAPNASVNLLTQKLKLLELSLEGLEILISSSLDLLIFLSKF
jgi:hypothetical protein